MALALVVAERDGIESILGYRSRANEHERLWLLSPMIRWPLVECNNHMVTVTTALNSDVIGSGWLSGTAFDWSRQVSQNALAATATTAT